MKNRIICIILLVFLTLSIPVFATSSTIQATIANVKINVDSMGYSGKNPIINYNGYNYVPVGELGRALGADVYWMQNTKTIEIFTKAPANFVQMKALNRICSYYHIYYTLTTSDADLQYDILDSVKTRNIDSSALEASYKQIGDFYTTINKNLATYNDTAKNANITVKFDEIDKLISDALIYHGKALDCLYEGKYTECIDYEIKAVNSMADAESLSNSEYFAMVKKLDNVSYK